MNRTPGMERALQAIAQSGTPTFGKYILDASGRMVAVLNGNTLKALERRGLIIIDHIVEYPQDWIVDSVFYRLVADDHKTG